MMSPLQLYKMHMMSPLQLYKMHMLSLSLSLSSHVMSYNNNAHGRLNFLQITN
jgi:hypothetical protein